MLRFGLGLILSLLLLAAPLRAAEPAAAEAAWQQVVTGQIEAFRQKDAPGAFQYASAPFQTTFASPEAFFAAIVASGYAPIMNSSSHSFGEHTELGPGSVAQLVHLTGTDLSRYDAIYVLTEEPDGWRVSGVQLVKMPGMGV